MTENKNIEINTLLLINYAHGLLAPEISFKVKNALEGDETLRLQYQGIVKLMKDYPDKDPEVVLDEMYRSLNKKAHSPVHEKNAGSVHSIKWWRPLVAAASIILLIGFAFIFKWQNDRSNPELLAKTLVEEATYSEATRDGTSPVSAWQEAFTKEDFNFVIRELKAKDGLNHTEQFYLGLSYLKLSPPQAANAEMVLQKATVPGMEYVDNTWLYLGIAQLLQKKNKEAIQSLVKIKENPQAAELLERLRK